MNYETIKVWTNKTINKNIKKETEKESEKKQIWERKWDRKKKVVAVQNLSGFFQ